MDGAIAMPDYIIHVLVERMYDSGGAGANVLDFCGALSDAEALEAVQDIARMLNESVPTLLEGMEHQPPLKGVKE